MKKILNISFLASLLKRSPSLKKYKSEGFTALRNKRYVDDNLYELTPIDQGQDEKVRGSNNVHYQKLITMLDNDGIYKNPLLGLQQVADELGISACYFSQVLNKVVGKSFSDIVGKYRVEETKRMLRNAEFYAYTILSIGYEAGFNSKSAMYKTFKKHTGMTPTQFRKLEQIESTSKLNF